MNKGVAP